VRLSVDRLACRRAGRLIFRDLSFSVGPGEALAVTGRNGAGKSSLLAILAGRLQPEEGAAAAEEAGERGLPECLHFVGHRDGLKTALTAQENLAFARDFLGDPAFPPEEALEAVGLAHAARIPVGYLSAGQRRRVALSRLLVAHRPLWLLDEPTSALDAASRDVLRGLMGDHLAAGGLIVAATHQDLGIDARTIRMGRDPGLSPPPHGEEAGVWAPRSGRTAPAPSSPRDGEVSRAAPEAGGAGPLRRLGGGTGARPFRALLRRDLVLARRIGGSGWLGLLFFLMIVTLVPFALGPDLNLLSRIGPAILWIAAVLATLVGLDRLFQADEEDGSLDILRSAPAPLEAMVLAKVAAHWLTTGLPLALAAPLFGLLLALPPEATLAVTATLLVGTPALTFIGAVGAALTVSLRRGGLILAALVLPLMLPTLIFGVSAANAATGGTVPFATPFLILAAISLVAGVVGTAGATAALRYE
jgi:heme exporter protein B